MANSYSMHGFISGMKLTGTAMAEMDTQIKDNADNIDVLTGRMDAVMYERQEEIRSLTLETDGQSLMLYYHSELLGEITLPGDLDSIIPCTALSVAANQLEVFIGETPAQIVATKQPSDCNQHLKFLTGDVRKCTVTSAGVVTGIGVADVPVTVKCGSFSQTVTAKVKKRISFDGHASVATWVQVAQEGRTPQAVSGTNNTSLQFQYTGDNKFFCNAPFDPTKFVIHPGEKVTVTMIAPLSLRAAFIVKAEYNDPAPAVVDLLNDYDVLYFTPVTQVVKISGDTTNYTTRTFSYSNNLNEDVWVGFMCDIRGTTDYQTILDDVDDYISMIISAADPAV